MTACELVARCHDGTAICHGCAFALDREEFGTLEALIIAARHGRPIPDEVREALEQAAMDAGLVVESMSGTGSRWKVTR